MGMATSALLTGYVKHSLRMDSSPLLSLVSFPNFIRILSPGDPHQRIRLSRNAICDIITSLVFLCQ